MLGTYDALAEPLLQKDNVSICPVSPLSPMWISKVPFSIRNGITCLCVGNWIERWVSAVIWAESHVDIYIQMPKF